MKTMTDREREALKTFARVIKNGPEKAKEALLIQADTLNLYGLNQYDFDMEVKKTATA